MAEREPDERCRETDIAIIGLSCRFPGSPDAEAFWRNLRDGVECITFFSEEELRGAGVDKGLLRDPRYVRAAGTLAGVDLFDASLFGFTPREAEITDPQQRIFLECAWEALEDAGYPPGGCDAPVGVFAGAKLSGYLLRLLASPAVLAAVDPNRLLHGNDKDYLATQTSYRLNLRGPSIAVQTACSTSLVAVHLACQSLINGECDLALAGGVAVDARQVEGYLYQEDGINSPDGHCRAFDARAQGTVGGSGAGVVVLKRALDALQDGDPIRAILRGSAVNNDGSLKVGYTAPSVSGQAAVISEAIAVAGIDPSTIDYVEAHGTGTSLGDPIEIAALNQVFGRPRRRCALGSVKSNIGHLDTAAGVAGLIKTVLALERRALPPSLHFERPNPKIDFDRGPFFVNASLTEWEANGRPRRAGVSSFGIGGTNAHAVLEEAPIPEPSGPSHPWQLLLLSAHTDTALEAMTADLARFLEERTGPPLADVAHTLRVGRRALPYRRMLVCRDAAEAVVALWDPAGERVRTARVRPGHRSAAFLFPGQGAQRAGMAAGLYRSEPVFRGEVDRCAAILAPHLRLDLRRLLDPAPGEERAAAVELDRTEMAQPALFVVEYALARLWMEWGVRPEAMIGHSIGEYVAACLAGVFTLEDALRLVAARGRLVQELPGGAMTSVPLPAEELRSLLGPELSLAAVNAPELCTVSGPADAVAELECRLAEKGLEYRRLRTSHAFHSPMMEPAQERFAEELHGVALFPPKLRFLSNVTGAWAGEEVARPEYWVRHLRETVRFAAGAAEMLREEGRVLLEVGPGRTLASLVRRQLGPRDPRAVIPSLPHTHGEPSDVEDLFHAAGQLWLQGLAIDWSAFSSRERRRRVRLPTYPFERRRYWVEEPEEAAVRSQPPPVRRPDPADWFQVAVWKQAVRRSAPPAAASRWLLFLDETGLGREILRRLEASGRQVATVKPGDRFRKTGDREYRLDPRRADDYRRLLDELASAGGLPERIVHLWSVTADGAEEPEGGEPDTLQSLGFFSLLSLAQALGERSTGRGVAVEVVSTGLYNVTGEEPLCPDKATLLGPCRVAPQEIPDLRMRSIDLAPPRPGQVLQLAERVWTEVSAERSDPVVALRGGHRWVPAFEPVRLERGEGRTARLRDRGVYLLTGGLGGIGLEIAGYLAREARARLVLIGRSVLPPREEWEDRLGSDSFPEEEKRKIRRLLELEELGGEVMVASADVSDRAALAEVIAAARARFGAIHGAVHAAGVPGGGVIALKTEEMARSVLAPKAAGMRALWSLLAGEGLDFLVLCSSLASITGGAGQVDYVAANAFLDAWAQRATLSGEGPFTVSANWCTWSEAGMAVAALADATGEQRAARLRSGLRSQEGIEAFRRILGCDLPQVIVSPQDFLSAASPGQTGGETLEEDRPSLSAHPRPDLSRSYLAPRDPTEETIAGLWRELLGIDRIGVHDDFTELGGDSLLAIRLLSRLRSRFEIDLPLRSFFDQPTVAFLAESVERAAKSGETAQVPPLEKAPRDRPLPLSFAQQRLWFLDRLDPGSAAYNMPLAVRLEGALDAQALGASLSEVTRRHEVLRTTFTETPEGGPVQVIGPPSPVPLPRVDLSGLPGPELAREVRRLAEEEAQRPFDLVQGPLLQCTLMAMGSDYVLLLTMHHIVGDDWSTNLLIRETAELYRAFSQGLPSTLSELPIQYADFAWWQRQWLTDEVLSLELSYWRDELAGLPPRLELPADRPRPAVQTSRGATVSVRIPERLAATLRALSQECGATLFMTLLAAFQALLSRHCGQDDLAVGTPVAGRRHLALEGLIGFFVNTLVLRSRLADGIVFRELLEQVRGSTLAAFAHQDVPFERLVEELQVERSLSYGPLFQVMLSLQPVFEPVADLPGLTLSRVDFGTATAQFDLTLALGEGASGELAGVLEYDCDLFDATTVLRLAGHLRALLEGVATDPQRRLAEVPLLSAAELHALLWEWNEGGPARAEEMHLANLFAEQAVRAPDIVAIWFHRGGWNGLTYGELAQRADRLARRLRRLGVGPDVPVAVFAESSPELVTALLATLQAGGAYLPLDPAYPQERLSFLLADSGAPVVLTLERLRARIPACDALVLTLDVEVAEVDPEPPVSGIPPESLAWILYTSGSTGRPKGVGVEHRAAVGYVKAASALFRLRTGDRILQFASPSFDISLEDLLPSLTCGVSVVLRGGELWAPADLLARAAELSLTVLNLPTAFWYQCAKELVDAVAPSGLAVRLVAVGGEAMTAEGVRLWEQTPLAGACLINGYGPTEAVITATALEVDRVPAGSSVPVGSPVGARSAHVLGRRGELAPSGAFGELCLGGALLARGYLGRPELTAERFVPNSFGGPGSRLYRTGDLARRQPDGTLVYLGRMDHQVKVRGFRIELGEIETSLEEHPKVQRAAVIVREEPDGSRGLLAYVVPDGEAAPALTELREHLAAKLPGYMVPARFALLDELPLTPSGKVDRRALAGMIPSLDNPASPSAAPRTPIEELLAGVFIEVLGVERVGREDSFFDLGGHSLLATRLVARVPRVFGVDLPVRAVFESPTVAGLAAQIDREMQAGRGRGAVRIERVSRSEPLPLSFSQQRLWLIEQRQPGSPAYNIPAAVRMMGDLDIAALAAALREITRRHEALRTVFVRTATGEPVQVFVPSSPGLLPVIDLRSVPEPRRLPVARQLAAEEAQRPFDLERGPLLRQALIALGDRDHLALLMTHHIVSDGWSTGVLIRELQALYQAFSQGLSSPLPELAIQYADFAAWQRLWLTGELLESELAYWRERLGGALPVLELPTDRPRSLAQISRGASRPFEIPEELSRALQPLSRRQEATLFMTLLAAFQVLLARYTGQEDVVVGTPIAGRDQIETEELIGFFVNTLVLRSDLSGNPTFLELLNRVREVTLSAYTHQYLPFEKLVEELQPERSLDQTPLFQVMFVLRNEPSEPLAMAGLDLEPLEVETGAAKFDLTLLFGERLGRVAGIAGYRRDLFDASSIGRMLGHFESLLAGIAADPGEHLSDLPLLSEGERHQLRVEWNDSLETASEACLHELFEAWAERQPDALAVLAADVAVTYGELRRRAGRLALRLRGLGVAPESRVALCLERSPDMVVAALAVLAAGGAYVPLDPELPSARLAWMLADSGAALLLTEERLERRLPTFDGLMLPLDLLLEDTGEGATAAGPEITVSPWNLAYIVYTSGTTGRPKGVLGTHAGAASYLRSLLALHALGTTDRVLQLPSFAFDAAVRDLFGPLAAGAAVVLAETGKAKDPVALLDLIAKHGVTRLLSVVPTLLRALAEAAPSDGRGASLRTILLSGERLYLADCARAWQAFGKAVALFNQYGPTECTMTSSYHRVLRHESARVEALIGRPVAGRRFHILGPGASMVPMGGIGELHIASEGLARGYLGQPGLTAERFLPDPFSVSPGRRMYSTGDLVRYRSDGNLEFLGRIDQQVKLWGFRIEPAEIEAALMEHPAVRAAAVVIRDGPVGSGELLACVVSEPGARSEADALRSALAARLPAYMVPAGFAFLEALPLTPNGKVDRKALARMELTPEPGSEVLAAPRTPVEQMLEGIFAEVLRRERIGVQDSFFELGGHSLLAIQLMARMQKVFDIDLPLEIVFEVPTVAGLAEHVERALSGGEKSQVPPIERIPRDRPLPLSFAQQRLWFLDRLEPGRAMYNFATAFQLQGPLDRTALSASLSELVRRHEALRTNFAIVEGEPVQVISPFTAVPLPIIDLRSLPPPQRAGEVRRLAREGAQQPFDLAEDSLLRATLMALAEEEHVVLAIMHHIVSDGWSMGVFVRELVVLYQAFLEGRPSPLPELEIQYADFAHWQRCWLSGERLETELAYWQERLKGLPPVLEILTDRPRPATPTFQGESCPLSFSGELTGSLRRLSLDQGATLFMTLLAAFQIVLARHSGQDDLAVGTPTAGRSDARLEDLIGFFVNTLVLRTDLSGDPTFVELLGRARESVLSAYVHQDLPFEKLVEELRPVRSLSHPPLFQVMFILQNVPAEPLKMPGLVVEPLREETGTIAFDLTLPLWEIADGLAGSLEYNRDLFDTPTARRMAGHFEAVVRGLLMKPESRLSDLPLLGDGERAQLTAEWNDTALATEWPDPIHELFERWAERSPDGTALVFEREVLSYGELSRRAEQLAAFLGTLGVGPEVRVGLSLESSPEMIVGLLGIFKAGGAYVPLDPTYPQDRIAFMLEDSGVGIVLTQECFRPAMPRIGVRVLCLDSEWGVVGSSTGGASCGGGTAGSAAYVIYTSGSTGTPKGVVATHGGLASFARSMAQVLDLRPGDRMLQFASLSFDASAVQIFPTLASGATLVLHRNPRGLSSRELLDLCAETGVTVLDLPAALWRQWVLDVLADGAKRATGVEAPIRACLTGGEAVPAAALRDWARGTGVGVGFLSSYGPTEATVTTTVFQTTSDRVLQSPAAADAPLGRPLPGARVYLLDGHGEPVPIGAAGEVCIGGTGVTRGYLHDPRLTADRFQPDPWSAQPGARLYRTGDLAQRSPDGTLRFLGRRDHQVKLRGYRVELGEVEAAIGSHPGIRDKLVLLREDVPGDRRLVAYVVPERPEELRPEELRAHLSGSLPDYMVPSHIVPLPELPLLPSGKVDRAALPAPDVFKGRQRERAAPRTPTELALIPLWQELLQVRPLGVRDDFFALGGHSLLSVRLMAMIRSRLGRDLPLAVLFEAPTIEHLAHRLDEMDGGKAWSPLVALQPQGTKPPFFCVHPIGGGVVGYHYLARYLGSDQPFYGLQAPGLESQGSAPHLSIEEMATGYLAAARNVQPRGPYLLGGASFGGVVAFEMAQQLLRQGEEVALLVLIDTPVPPGREDTPAFESAVTISTLVREEARQQGRELALTSDALRGLPLEGQLQRALEELRGAGVVGEEIDASWLGRFLTGFETRLRAVERYVADPYSGRIVLFRPLQLDPESAGRVSAEDLTRGWGGLASEGVEVYHLPGYHETLTLEPHVRDLAEILRSCIARATGTIAQDN